MLVTYFKTVYKVRMNQHNIFSTNSSERKIKPLFLISDIFINPAALQSCDMDKKNKFANKTFW